MCGIAGQLFLNNESVPNLDQRLGLMSRLLAHRGPDGHGQWISNKAQVGFVHRRLAIIDLSQSAAQPMVASNGTAVTYNGEIYNYPELRQSFADRWTFRSHSDTESILAAYERYGDECLGHMRGMFAFALWDEKRQRLFCARDRFGIKPFYYAVIDGIFISLRRQKPFCPFCQKYALMTRRWLNI